MLDQDTVLEDGDLRALACLANHHDPLHGLAAGKELRLREDRCATTTGFAAFATTLLLRLEAGGSA